MEKNSTTKNCSRTNCLHLTVPAPLRCAVLEFPPSELLPYSSTGCRSQIWSEKKGRDQRFRKLDDKYPTAWVTPSRISMIKLSPVARIIPMLETMGHMGTRNIPLSLKSVYCLRTKQTTSKYIWHQHLTVLQADPSFQNPKKTPCIRVSHKFCWSTWWAWPFSGGGSELHIVLLTPGCSPRAKWPHPSSLLPFHAGSGTLSLERRGWELGCLSHSSSHPLLRSEECLGKRGQLGAGWVSPWNAMAELLLNHMVPPAASRKLLMLHRGGTVSKRGMCSHRKLETPQTCTRAPRKSWGSASARLSPCFTPWMWFLTEEPQIGTSQS